LDRAERVLSSTTTPIDDDDHSGARVRAQSASSFMTRCKVSQSKATLAMVIEGQRLQTQRSVDQLTRFASHCRWWFTLSPITVCVCVCVCVLMCVLICVCVCVLQQSLPPSVDREVVPCPSSIWTV
jgi:hypothetical protein